MRGLDVGMGRRRSKYHLTVNSEIIIAVSEIWLLDLILLCMSFTHSLYLLDST